MAGPIELELRTVPSVALQPAERARVIALCSQAYEEDFAPYLEQLTGGTHLLAYRGNELVSHAMWVIRWLQPAGLDSLRTAYVEAVATAPAWQGRGFGRAVMRRLQQAITDFTLGALSPSDPAWYAPLGWELWRGPLSIRTPAGSSATPDEQVMILRLPGTPPLNLEAGLSAEWRAGELW